MLKWIYNLGVQHERNRIKRLIAVFTLQVENSRNEFELFMEGRRPERERNQRKQDLDTLYKAKEIVDRLIEPRLEREYTKSALDGED